MKYQDLYVVLNKKWKESADQGITKAELAAKLGLSVQTLVNWESSEKELTATQVANLLIKATDVAVSAAHLNAVRPIVEIFPIDAHKRSERGEKNWDVFDGGKNATGYMKGMRCKTLTASTSSTTPVVMRCMQGRHASSSFGGR